MALSKDRQRLYWVWCDMRYRCTKPRHAAYKNYGGRGISVCESWSSFAQFEKDMGEKPSPAHTIERIDNDGDYSPENCRWATRHEQALNKRDYRNNTSGHRNIYLEKKTIRGRTYQYWRVRVRRDGEVIGRRFKALPEAIDYRNEVESSYAIK